MMNILSLGAGVQSSTMALMAAHGEITPMPDCAIFADTQAEGVGTYRHLDWLEKQLSFPLHRVTAGSLMQNAMQNKTPSGHDFQDITWRTHGGMGRRQCTSQYKILPIYRKIRELTKDAVNLWQGISADEAERMKPARVKYVNNIYPLVDRNMTRLHCMKWLQDHGYSIPPKSSCVFCPYKGNAEWRELSEYDFEIACKVDEKIRTFGVEQYAHRDLVPLRQADIRSAEEAGQLSMFGNECEGMCGV